MCYLIWSLSGRVNLPRSTRKYGFYIHLHWAWLVSCRGSDCWFNLNGKCVFYHCDNYKTVEEKLPRVFCILTLLKDELRARVRRRPCEGLPLLGSNTIKRLTYSSADANYIFCFPWSICWVTGCSDRQPHTCGLFWDTALVHRSQIALRSVQRLNHIPQSHTAKGKVLAEKVSQ